MSFTKEKRNRIKNYIMEKIFKKQVDFVKRTANAFSISPTTVYKYVNELEQDGLIAKDASGNYYLVKTLSNTFSFHLKEKTLEEDVVYRETLSPYVVNFPGNVVHIWEYAFMEMFNNVIDHSNAERVIVSISQNALYTWVNIFDNGIGIFRKIADFYHYESLDDAIFSLFKGKLTTDSHNHSGEGIFFTSKVMDHFGAISDQKIFSQDNTKEIVTDLVDSSPAFRKMRGMKGTLIIMALANDTTRTLKEIFDMYSDDNGGFTITQIPIKHICDSGYPVSRSQAKRLYFGFDKFKTVILDFKDVEEIGQGFADELFRVYQNNHPEIELRCVNTNEAVERMIRRTTMN